MSGMGISVNSLQVPWRLAAANVGALSLVGLCVSKGEPLTTGMSVVLAAVTAGLTGLELSGQGNRFVDDDPYRNGDQEPSLTPP
jgi:hypothetical protein